jgi:tRNA dimethylallyltransferase
MCLEPTCLNFIGATRVSLPRFIADIPSDIPILIAGPTASGKSSLALSIAHKKGGRILNADALQVYENWRVLTARPNLEEETLVPHSLYGHVDGTEHYSVGGWLRDIQPHLGNEHRPIIVGGTGLYFKALTSGLAQIPPIPPLVREKATEKLNTEGLEALIADLDHATQIRLDLQNPMRVQRAWEVFESTRRSIAQWQDETQPPLLELGNCSTILFDVSKDWLNKRINKRFDKMLTSGALEEAQSNSKNWNQNVPSSKAIGAKELVSYLAGDLTFEEAKERATIATRQFAKRQRTWFRSNMKNWRSVDPRQL